MPHPMLQQPTSVVSWLPRCCTTDVGVCSMVVCRVKWCAGSLRFRNGEWWGRRSARGLESQGGFRVYPEAQSGSVS